MSVYLKNAPNQSYRDKVSPYDVKIIGGKRITTLRQPTQLRDRNAASAFAVLPGLQSSPDSVGSNDLGDGGSRDIKMRAKTALPPITKFDQKRFGGATSGDENKQTNNEKQLQLLQRHLQRIDTGNRRVLTIQQINKEFKDFQIDISNEQLRSEISKCISPNHHGMVDYNKLIVNLMTSKKRSKMAVQTSESIKRNAPLQSNKNAWQAKTSYLRQEEMPLLTELRRQLNQFGSIDLATLYRHANETDRERKGVLTKSQIQTILNKNGIHLTDNLLKSLLHYSDRDGYQLYSVTKFLDYFDHVVKEERALLKGNNRTRFAARIQSPPPKSPPPVLDFVMPSNTYVEEEEEEPETDVPFDKNDWLRRFNSMAAAMGDSYQEFAGYLPIEDVRHIVENYNLIYNLNLPRTIIDQSISRSVNHGNNQVDVRQFLSILHNSYLQYN